MPAVEWERGDSRRGDRDDPAIELASVDSPEPGHDRDRALAALGLAAER